jgi:ligand-binding sensor domain-containing protein
MPKYHPPWRLSRGLGTRPAPHLLGLLLAASLCAASGETLNYNSRVWRTDDGLPHNSILAIAQSEEGYLWIGTRQGLARFDGVKFTTAPALDGVSVTALCRGSDGTLWIGTGGNGLKCCRNRKIEDVPREDASDGVILSIASGPEGSVWVGTTKGLCYVRRRQ